MKLTVGLLVSTGRDRARRVLDSLAAQDCAADLDVVVVDLLGQERAPLPAPAGLGSMLTIASSAPDSTTAKTELVEAANTPFVAFIEDHCYPEPGWASAIIAAFEEGADAVGYSFDVENPGNALSRAEGWSHMTIAIHAETDRPSQYLNGGNVAYRREAIAGLEHLLGAEFLLQIKLHERGRRLRIAAAARARHEQFEHARGAIAATVESGRALAAARIRHGRWTRRRRAAAAVAVLVVAPTRRTISLARRYRELPAWRAEIRSSLPWVGTMFVVAAVAESVAYLRPPPDDSRLLHYELDVPRRKR